jgi:hypothetical protein
MSARKPLARNNHLEEAMALLIRSQAAFVDQIAGTIRNASHLRNGSTRPRYGSTRLASIEATLLEMPKTILKSVLEQLPKIIVQDVLAKLPKAVKKEIGLTPPA